MLWLPSRLAPSSDVSTTAACTVTASLSKRRAARHSPTLAIEAMLPATTKIVPTHIGTAVRR